MEAYQSLFTRTGFHFLNQGNGISRKAFAKGYCLFAYDLTPDLSANDNSHLNLVRHNSVRLDVRFHEPLTTTINCIIYGEYANVLEIDLLFDDVSLISVKKTNQSCTNVCEL